MTQEELNKLLKKHEQWLRGNRRGEQLFIGDRENVKGLDFSGRDLRFSLFMGTDLSFTSFLGVNLQGAHLGGVILNHTDFECSTIPYDEDLILKLAESIKESRKKKSPSESSAQAPSAKADKKGQ